jgi:hypothetical protein
MFTFTVKLLVATLLMLWATLIVSATTSKDKAALVLSSTHVEAHLHTVPRSSWIAPS